MTHGNPGQHRNITGDVYELKIDAGSNYHVYSTQHRREFIILLGGGDKSSQQQDIALALELARNIQE